MKKMGKKYGKMNLIRVKSNGKMSVVENLKEDGHTDVASVERKLKLIGQYTIDLIRQLQNMSNEDSLPSWWTDKITLAKDYIEKSRNYLVVPVEGFASDAQRRAAFASGYKEKGKKKKKNEDITSSGYSQLKKIAYGISVGLKDLSKGIRNQNDDMVLPEIEYIYDKATEMKKMLKNKRFNESVNEAERKMSSLEMQQIILLAKAMREMPGSPAQKKIKKQINVIRKKLGQAPVKESVNEGKGVEKILKMASEKSFGKIAGRTVDGMTAGLFKAVYDKAPQNAKDKIDKMNEKQLYVFMGKLWNKFGRQVKLS
jgi:hypothetical protein